MDRMRMDVVESLRVSSDESKIHSRCNRKLQPSPMNLRSVSLSVDIPSMGINGIHLLAKEHVNDDGLAGVYTSKPMVYRKRLIDGDEVEDIGCINDTVNMAVSRSNSQTCFMGKLSVWAQHIVSVNGVSSVAAHWMFVGLRKVKPEVNDNDAILSGTTFQSVNEEELRRQLQAELAHQKNEETAWRLAGASVRIGDDPGVLEPSNELIAYNNVNDLPARWGKLGIPIDSENKAILLPFYGSMVDPYTCSSELVGLGTSVAQIEKLQQVFDTVEREALIIQEKLVLARDKSRTIKLSNVCIHPWPARWGRQIPGTLEAHVNGFRYYASKPDQQVDIMFGNIKHAVFQPAENEMKTLLHFHLHKRIMIGNRIIANNVQFYHEVMEVGETLGGWRRSPDDPVEIEGEHGEREGKNKINEEFEIVVSLLNDLWLQPLFKGLGLEFDRPLRDLGFYGVHDGATEFIVPTAACLIELTPSFLVITLSEIVMASLERVGCGQKNFDMVIVFKDLKRNVFPMKSIPTTSLKRINVWLDSIDIKHYESRINLRWRPILKTIMVEPHLFIEDGEWDFLNMDRSDSDSEKSDEDYEPSDVESLAFESSVESEDDEEDSEEDLEEEEMTWFEWEEAINADCEVGNKSNSEGKRWRMEMKALGKSRGGTSSTSSPKRVKLETRGDWYTISLICVRVMGNLLAESLFIGWRQKHGTEGRIKQLTCTLHSYADERCQDKVFTSMLLSRSRCSSSTTAQPLRQNHALKLNSHWAPSTHDDSAGNEPCRAHPTSFLEKSTQRSVSLFLPLPFVGNVVLSAGNTFPPNSESSSLAVLCVEYRNNIQGQ
ncbi:hypothetical protein Ancab_033241 [Ancistrocladus abbreviatus]